MRSMMKTAPKGSKLRTELGMCAARIRVMSERKKAAAKTSRREVSQLLARGNDASARIQVEDAIRKDNTAMAYDMLEQYCQLLMKHAALLDGKECPPELKEAVASVVYAARLTGTDLPELSEVRSMVKSRFGKDFVAAAESLRPQCGVNTRLHTLLSACSPRAEEKVAALKRIAAEHGVAWDASRFESDVRLASEPVLSVSPPSAAASTPGGGGHGHANSVAGGYGMASPAEGAEAVGLQAEQLQQPSSQEQKQYERFQHLQRLQQQQQQQQQPQQADWLRGASGRELPQHAKAPPAVTAPEPSPAGSAAAVTAPEPPPAGSAAAASAAAAADVYAQGGAMWQQQQSLTSTPSQQGGQPKVQQVDQRLGTLRVSDEPVPALFDESDLELLPPPPPAHHMPPRQSHGSASPLEGRGDSRRQHQHQHQHQQQQQQQQQQQKKKQYEVQDVAVVATASSAADAFGRGDAARVPDEAFALEQRRQRQQQLEAIRKIGERARIAAMRPNPATHLAQSATGAALEAAPAAAAAAHTRAAAGAAASNVAAMKMAPVVEGGREDHGPAKSGGRLGSGAVEGIEEGQRGDGFAGVGQWDNLPVFPASSSAAVAAAAAAARSNERSSPMPQDSARQARSSNECNDTANSTRGSSSGSGNDGCGGRWKLGSLEGSKRSSDDEEASAQLGTVAAALVPATEELDGTVLPPPPPPSHLAVHENAQDLAPGVEGVDSRTQQPPVSQPKHPGNGSPVRSPGMGWVGGHPALEDLKARYERLVKDKPPARNW